MLFIPFNFYFFFLNASPPLARYFVEIPSRKTRTHTV